jgi:hypothetical protein
MNAWTRLRLASAVVRPIGKPEAAVSLVCSMRLELFLLCVADLPSRVGNEVAGLDSAARMPTSCKPSHSWCPGPCESEWWRVSAASGWVSQSAAYPGHCLATHTGLSCSQLPAGLCGARVSQCGVLLLHVAGCGTGDWGCRQRLCCIFALLFACTVGGIRVPLAETHTLAIRRARCCRVALVVPVQRCVRVHSYIPWAECVQFAAAVLGQCQPHVV